MVLSAALYRSRMGNLPPFEFEEDDSGLQQDTAPQSLPSGEPAGCAEEKSNIVTLYRSQARSLTETLRKYFGNGPPDPEDITQLAFQKLIERKDLGDVRSLKGFLWRTARNLMLKEKRSADVRSKYDFEIEQLFFPAKRDEMTPERVLSAQAQLQVIDEALRKMPVRRRRCFILHKVEGLPIAEVGEVMGLPKSTAHRDIVRAGIEIDACLQRLGGDSPI